MAVVAGKKTNQFIKYVLTEWLALANGDTGSPALSGYLSDRTVQVDGTFGVGGSVTLQGSMNAVDWFTLMDDATNALTFTAAGMKIVLENPLHIRPNVTSGDGATALNVRMGASSLK